MDTTTYIGAFDGDDAYDHVADADDPRTADARDEESRYAGTYTDDLD